MRRYHQPRRTAIEFHELQGRKYILNGWGTKTDWFRNLAAHPCVTIQTWRRAESMTARRIMAEAELAEAIGPAMTNPTHQPTPEPLPADLAWT